MNSAPRSYDEDHYTRPAQTDAVVGGAVLPYLIYTGPEPPEDPAARGGLARAYCSELLLRHAAWVAQQLPRDGTPPPLAYRELRLRLPHFIYDEDEGLPSAEPRFHDLRARLEQWHDLILLGPSGSGKTATLWRLARDLADECLRGDLRARLPILIQLAAQQGARDALGLLRDELEHAAVSLLGGRQQPLTAHRLMAQLLPELLASERLVLLWDGLDEIPHGLGGATSAAIEELRSAAVRRILHVVSCRAGAYPIGGPYSQGLHITVKQAAIEPLDEPSARALIQAHLGDERASTLLPLLERPANAALAGAMRNPLLLSLICEVVAANGELPSSRGRLLRALVVSRLSRGVRLPSHGQLESRLARLACVLSATRGRGSAAPLAWALEQLGAPDLTGPGREAPPPHLPATADPAHLLQLALDAGLLTLVRGGAMVRFSHAFLQDYFAAIGVGVQLATAEATAPGPQNPGLLGSEPQRGWQRGWEEVLLLLASIDGEGGLLHLQLSEALAPIPLAAARAIEADPAAAEPYPLRLVREAALGQISDITRGFGQRRDAGIALGLVDDPRTPLSPQAWRDVTVRRGAEGGRAEGYWCYVQPGTYRIGGWADGQEAAEIMLGAFWIGRFPITVAQFRGFATEGYGAEAERWWPPQGWAWRLRSRCTEPRHWDEPQHTGGSQPAVGVSWYEAAAYCAWLSEVLREILPAGQIVRLPTEAEWEAAAAFDGAGLRRRHPWGQMAPTLNDAISSEAGQMAAAPVGCCPAGAAASGALDMLGNVEEWCASWYGDYPRGSGREVSDPPAGRGVLLGPLGSRQLPVRGGWWAQRPEQLWCGHRFWHEASAASSTTGFRIVLATPDSEGALPQERSEWQQD